MYDDLAVQVVVDDTPPGSGDGSFALEVLTSPDGEHWFVWAEIITGTVHRGTTETFFGSVSNEDVCLFPLVKMRVGLSGAIDRGHVRVFAVLRDPSD